MPETRHYEAVDSQGVTHKRSTARDGRSYTHCIIARGNCTYGARLPFTTVEFASRQDLAEAAAQKWRRKSHCTSVEVVEARLFKITGRKKIAA